MKLKLIKIFLFISLCLSSALLCADTSTPENASELDSILASVNGLPIVLSDVIFESARDENILAAALNVEKAREIILEMRKKLTDDIINRKLIIAEYEKGSFRIPEEYINAEIDEIAKSTNHLSRKKFYQALRASGLDLHEFREKIREKIIVEFVVGKTLYNRVNISPKKTYEYYSANKEKEFTIPDKFELSMIFINKDREDYSVCREKIAYELAANATLFPSLAVQYSDNEISKKNNGVIGCFQLSEIRDEFKDFVSKMNLGVVSPEIETAEGVYYLVINKIEKGREIPFREIEQSLKKKLENTERQQVFLNYIENLRKNAIIEYYF